MKFECKNEMSCVGLFMK